MYSLSKQTSDPKSQHGKQPSLSIHIILLNRTYDNAESDDLWRHLTTAAHEDGTLPQDVTVKMIMDTWTLQKGYPVIMVERSADGTSATVSQVSPAHAIKITLFDIKMTARKPF